MKKLLFGILLFVLIGGGVLLIISWHNKSTTPTNSESDNNTMTDNSSKEPNPTTQTQSEDIVSEDVNASNESVNHDNDSSFDNTNDDNSTDKSNPKEEDVIHNLLYEESNEFTGMIGEAKIHLKLSYQDNNIVGSYYYDKYKTDIAIQGNITFEIKDHPAITMLEETENYGKLFGVIETKDCIKGYWHGNDQVYPMYLVREGLDIVIPEKPDSNTKSYEGLWYGKNSGYFSGTDLSVTALFRDMIYFDLEAYNGANSGSYSGIAYVDSNSASVMVNYYYWDSDYNYELFELVKQGDDLNLNCSDYSYGCGMGVSFDNQYSKEKSSVDEPSALDVGIVNSPELDKKFYELVRTYYSEFIQYTSAVAYEEITLDDKKAFAGQSLLRGIGGYCYYIISEDSIYAAIIDRNDIKYFTNDWEYYDQMPQTMKEWADNIDLPITYYNDMTPLPFDEDIPNQLIKQIEQLKQGQKITLPDGYSLMDYSEGDLNNDNEEELVIAVQQNPGNVTGTRYLYVFTNSHGKYNLEYVNDKILLGAYEGGVFGDPYSGFAIKKSELHVYDYGGSADRWSHDYVFKMIDDELILTSLVTNGMNTLSGEASESTYDFLNGTVKTTTYNEFDESVEKKITLGSFTINHQITFEDAKAWQEEDLILLPPS